MIHSPALALETREFRTLSLLVLLCLPAWLWSSRITFLYPCHSLHLTSFLRIQSPVHSLCSLSVCSALLHSSGRSEPSLCPHHPFPPTLQRLHISILESAFSASVSENIPPEWLSILAVYTIPLYVWPLRHFGFFCSSNSRHIVLAPYLSGVSIWIFKKRQCESIVVPPKLTLESLVTMENTLKNIVWLLSINMDPKNEKTNRYTSWTARINEIYTQFHHSV